MVNRREVMALMGAAASYIAKLLERYRWIAYIGLAIVVYVALSMIWHGYEECARILVDAGADLRLTGHDGKTPHALATEVFGAAHPLTQRVQP